MSENSALSSCFVVSPIGAEESETRRRADQVFKYVIMPVAEKAGYKVTRADKIAESGIINSQVIQRIVEDDLVIADLTDMNPNVFYELAIRHSIRRPYIQIMQVGQAIPFDVAGVRTVFFDFKDLDSVEYAKEQILAQIESIRNSDGLVDSPVSVSLDLQRLKQSGDPSQRSFAEIIDQLSEMRREFISFREETARSFLSDRYFTFDGQSYELRTTFANMKIARHEGLRVATQIEKMVDVLIKNKYSGDFDEAARGQRELASENLKILVRDLHIALSRLKGAD